MSKRKFNIGLAAQILAKIEKDPHAFEMSSWVHEDTTEVSDEEILDPLNVCDTTHCMAGWAIALSGNPLRWDDSYNLEIGTVSTGTVEVTDVFGNRTEPVVLEVEWNPIKSWDDRDQDPDDDHSEVIKLGAKRLGLSNKKARKVFLHMANEEARIWLVRKLAKEIKKDVLRKEEVWG